MFRLQHRIAGMLFPTHRPLLDQVNANAKMIAFYKSNPAIRKFPTRDEYFSYLNAEIGNVPITYLEFGVYRGESIKRWSEMNTNPNSRFVGFDSFEGLPEAWNADCGKGAFDVGGTLPAISDQRVSFVKGWFQNSLKVFLQNFDPADTRLIIHADADLYSATLYFLTMLDQYLRPGSIIMFDEFASAMHEFRAWNDYTSAYLRKAKPIAATTDTVCRTAFLLE